MFNIAHYIKQNYHRISTAIFVLGFAFDSIVLPDVDTNIPEHLGLLYIALIGFIILIREWVIARNTASKAEQNMYSILTLAISFFSGSILSFIFIYYFRSAELSVSWPLFIIFFGIMAANEFISSHSFRFMLDVGILLFSTIFFTIFNVPIILKEQNDHVFVISLLIGMVVSFFYLFLLRFASEMAAVYGHKAYALAVGIPIVVMMLYFTNTMPAVPLSLKNADVYHALTRTGDGEFSAYKEPVTKWQFWKQDTFHYVEGETIYFFSAIAAPAELAAPISHVWEYYDSRMNAWVPSTVVSFPITGGRDDGYRAYSKKDAITPGMWRVTVRVGDRRIVGRKTFEVVKVDTPVDVTEVKI